MKTSRSVNRVRDLLLTTNILHHDADKEIIVPLIALFYPIDIHHEPELYLTTMIDTKVTMEYFIMLVSYIY